MHNIFSGSFSGNAKLHRKPLKSTVLTATLAATLAITSLAAYAALKVDASKSAVTATFKQLNVPVEAKFRQFSASIDYNAAKPEASKASVDIAITSFDLGDPEYNGEVMKKDWFNAAQFPKAGFVSTSMKLAANGKLEAIGKLTIKGKTTDVSFPVSIKKDGSNLVFDGALPIKRLTFNIGEGEWKDTSTVADEVIIKFHVVTAQ